MSKKIKCLWHDEKTPSLHIYTDTMTYRCYGCNATGPLSNLPDSSLRELDYADFVPKPKENLLETMERIKYLPKKYVRGVLLPYDDRSFYIVWPDESYYLRRFIDNTEPKYIGPRGHDRPLFQPSIARSSVAVLTEGELNAASIATVYNGNVISVGGTGNFTQSRLTKYLPELNRYETIVVLLDDDTAGTLAAIEACGFLKAHGKVVKLCLLAKDANWVLEHEGKEGLKELMARCLEGRLEGSTIKG